MRGPAHFGQRLFPTFTYIDAIDPTSLSELIDLLAIDLDWRFFESDVFVGFRTENV